MKPAVIREGQDLRQYIVQRKWSVLFITVLAVATTLFFSYQQDPVYESEAKVVVKPLLAAPEDPESALAPNLETERGIAASVAVAERAADRIDEEVDPREIVDQVDVESDVESEILTITFSGETPLRARAGAQAFAQGYLDYRLNESLADLLASSRSLEEEVETLQTELDEINAQIASTPAGPDRRSLKTQADLLTSLIVDKEISRVTLPDQARVGSVVQPATVPTDPVSPNHIRAGALGVVLGLALGIAQAALRGRLDDRLHNQEEVELQLGAPVLASIPPVPAWRRSKAFSLIGDWESPNAASEAFRILRTNLVAASATRGLKTILVASSRPGEGKSTISINLATALAQTDKRVVLVSADLRKPRLHKLAQQPPASGLNEVLTGQVPLADACTRTRFENLILVASGTIAGDAAERLGSRRMVSVLKELSDQADYVILDAAPVSTADTVALIPLVDSVLFVAELRTLRRVLGRARWQLDKLGAHVIGVVLNRFDPDRAPEYGYYTSAYGVPFPQGNAGDGRGTARAERPTQVRNSSS